jgi:hypothetical protein
MALSAVLGLSSLEYCNELFHRFLTKFSTFLGTVDPLSVYSIFTRSQNLSHSGLVLAGRQTLRFLDLN